MGEAGKTIREIRRDGDTIVISLVGEVDLHHTPEVHKALVTACQQEPGRLVVNLGEVSYLDSSGIGTLVEVFRRVNGYGGTLALCGLNDRVLSVFEITKLDKFFKIYDNEQEALQA